MFKNKTFDITVKVVLTLLAVASAGGNILYRLEWPQRSYLHSIWNSVFACRNCFLV